MKICRSGTLRCLESLCSGTPPSPMPSSSMWLLFSQVLTFYSAHEYILSFVEWLDNDEDGCADIPLVVSKVILPLFEIHHQGVLGKDISL